MAEQMSEKDGPQEVVEEKEEEEEKGKNVDTELFSCLLQPTSSDSDPDYIGIRRLLLHRKAESGVLRRRVCAYCFELVLCFVGISCLLNLCD